MLTTTSNNNLLSLQTFTDFIQDKQRCKTEIESAVKVYLGDAKALQQLYTGYEDDLFLSSLGYILIGFNFSTQKVVVQIAEINQDNLNGFNPIEKYQQDFNPYEDALFFLNIKNNNPVRRFLQKDEITEEKCVQLLTNRIKKLIQTQINDLNLHSPYWGLAKNSYYLMCTSTSSLIRKPLEALALPINLFSVDDLVQYFSYLSDHRGFPSDVITVTSNFSGYPDRQDLLSKLNEIDGLKLTAISKGLSHWEKYLKSPDKIADLYSHNISMMIKTLFQNGWTLQQILELSEKAENSKSIRSSLLSAIEQFSKKYDMLETKTALSNWASHQNINFSENDYLVDMTDIQNTLKQSHISQYLYDNAMDYFKFYSFVFTNKDELTDITDKFEYTDYGHHWVIVMTEDDKKRFLEKN